MGLFLRSATAPHPGQNFPASDVEISRTGSFPRSPEDYASHLEQIAEYLNAWNSAETIRQYIQETRERPRLGKAVSIPIDPGQRRSEWFVDS